ncbi:hypothetical protein H7I93_30040 [Mycobacterium nebraskense]|uniref:hypothetical protein n=1 Tax=Mycobacterium nebraskense TaxID=244292 RepID=UPI00113FFB0F|nr:hypothetical protein [Mycobacterium nebraskense]MCV7121304.1 hypothetical protein [Mycobacterium nebraskense]
MPAGVAELARLLSGVALFGLAMRHYAGDVPTTHAPTVREAINSSAIRPKNGCVAGFDRFAISA